MACNPCPLGEAEAACNPSHLGKITSPHRLLAGAAFFVEIKSVLWPVSRSAVSITGSWRHFKFDSCFLEVAQRHQLRACFIIEFTLPYFLLEIRDKHSIETWFILRNLATADQQSPRRISTDGAKSGKEMAKIPNHRLNFSRKIYP